MEMHRRVLKVKQEFVLSVKEVKTSVSVHTLDDSEVFPYLKSLELMHTADCLNSRWTWRSIRSSSDLPLTIAVYNTSAAFKSSKNHTEQAMCIQEIIQAYYCELAFVKFILISWQLIVLTRDKS